MLVETKPTTRPGRFKRWLIEATFRTLNADGYRSWRPDQWYIARTKHISDYVSWKQLKGSGNFWMWAMWLVAWLMDILNAFNPSTSSLFWSYVWLVLGMVYLTMTMISGCMHGMKERYDSVVDARIASLLPFDSKTAYNCREHSHKGVTGEGFDQILHSEITNCVTGRFSLFYYDPDRDLLLDFADIADSLTVTPAPAPEKLT